jgi:hypothetical protein
MAASLLRENSEAARFMAGGKPYTYTPAIRNALTGEGDTPF